MVRGDHLAVQSDTIVLPKCYSVEYFHHGIYLEHDHKVADFSTDGIVKKVDLLIFTGQQPFFKFVYPDGKCNTPEAAAHLAEEAIDFPSIWGPYSVTKNNCEHFATKCKTGTPYSIQVDDFYRKVEKKMGRKSANSIRRNVQCAVL